MECEDECKAMVTKVLNRPDPADGAKERLPQLARQLWHSIANEDVPVERLAGEVGSASDDYKEKLFERWSGSARKT